MRPLNFFFCFRKIDTFSAEKEVFVKTVILFFSLLLQVIAAQAAVPSVKVAHHKEFGLESNFGFGHKVYYECSSAEDKIQFQMNKMGAMNVQVNCQGGIDWTLPSEFWNAYITLSYETLRLPSTGQDQLVPADWQQVNLNTFGDCTLMKQVFDETRDTFEMNSLVEPGRCLRSDSSFHLQFFTLTPL
jgi:hypothetical protein